MDWVKGRCGLDEVRVWTGKRESMDRVKRECGLGKAKVDSIK